MKQRRATSRVGLSVIALAFAFAACGKGSNSTFDPSSGDQDSAPPPELDSSVGNGDDGSPIFTTDSITGTSIRTPTTVARAAPESKPKRLMANTNNYKPCITDCKSS